MSRRAPRTSREAAACRMRCPPRPRLGAWRIRSIRPRRPSIERHGASVPTRVHLPPQLRHTRVSRKLRFRHLGVAIHELWLARPHRISTGCLVSQSVGMAPDHAATGRLPHGRYNSAGTKRGTRTIFLAPLPLLRSGPN